MDGLDADVHTYIHTYIDEHEDGNGYVCIYISGAGWCFFFCCVGLNWTGLDWSEWIVHRIIIITPWKQTNQPKTQSERKHGWTYVCKAQSQKDQNTPPNLIHHHHFIMGVVRKKTHKSHATPKKNRVYALLDYGLSIRRVSRLEKVPVTTVHRWKTHPTERRQYEHRVGRKKLLTEPPWRRIKRYVTSGYKGRTATYSTIIKELQLNCSVDTLHRFMAEHGYHKCKACQKPYINESTRKQRLEFARRYEHWSADDWEKVTFSDAVSFEVGKRSRDLVIRTRGERFCQDCLQYIFCHKKDKVMAWGAVGSLGQPDLVFLKGSGVRGGVTMEDYMDQVLEDVVAPAFEDLLEIVPDALYLEDNAPVHGSGKAQTLAEFKAARGISIIILPPYSPDLNIIENMWRALKQRLQRLPCIPQSSSELEDTAQRVWRQLGPDLWRKYIRTMPDRIKAVIRARGLQTKY